MKDTQQRLISSFVRICITLLFGGLAVLSAVARGPATARSIVVVIAALLCFTYLYSFPNRRTTVVFETQDEQRDAITLRQGSERRAIEQEIREWILREAAVIQKVKDRDQQIKRSQESAERCKTLFPLSPGEADSGQQLISKIGGFSEQTYTLNDMELASLRGLPMIYQRKVLKKVKKGIKLDYLELTLGRSSLEVGP